MVDFLILAPVIGFTAYIVVKQIRYTKEGKCSACSQASCDSCPSLKQ